MKWEDALQRYCTSDGHGKWKQVAASRETWADKADDFAKWFTKAAYIPQDIEP